MQKIILKREPKLDVKLCAFPYQLDALEEIKDLDYSAIFHEQGLGKTKIAIDLILYWFNRKLVDTVILVVKKSLLNNWQKELKLHTYLNPRILSQNRKSNYYVFNSPTRLILTHYEVIKSELYRFELFIKARNVGIILDESTRIKNPDSELSKAFFKLSPSFVKKVIMTGTPVANRPYDIWSQIYFLDSGKSLGNNYYEFKKLCDLSTELYNRPVDQNIFEDQVNSIWIKINKFSIRQTKNDKIIKLPKKIIHTLETQWESRQWEIYKQVRDELKIVILKDGIPSEDNSEVVLKRLLRLIQIASNPRLIDKSYNFLPGKYDYLTDLLMNIQTKGEKAIVWTSFTENVDWLNRELKEFNTFKVSGKLLIEERNSNIDRFINFDKPATLIATPGAAKEGLTLTVANHVIYFDRNFSLDDYLQSQDRIHRISQNKICHVYNIIMKDSIDLWVDLLLKAKQLAAQLTQGDITLEMYNNLKSYDFGFMLKEVLNISDRRVQNARC